ncbi:hypothetical protein [Spiroplasma endosymbiont of Seladonia tumulorum]|uniref:hypothetical protein n=1 Tax=Spiroplasma endosymbiont of Seladonia tumulorum TaxID=3066321 RepID=UPI0030CF9D16
MLKDKEIELATLKQVSQDLRDDDWMKQLTAVQNEINGEDLFHLLEKYKLNINKNNIFNADTTFTSICTNKRQEIYYNNNQINNLLIEAYEEKEVIL